MAFSFRFQLFSTLYSTMRISVISFNGAPPAQPTGFDFERLGRLKAVSAFSPKYSPAGWGPCINKSTTKPYVPRSPRFCLKDL